MEGYVSIGTLVAVHGTGGKLILKHGLGAKTLPPQMKSLLVEAERGGSLVPWFIKAIGPHKPHEWWLEVEGVETREAAVKLLKKKVLIKVTLLKKLDANRSPIAMIGYQVIENDKILGQVNEVIEQPHQLLCILYIGKKEVMIPLHKETLQKIDQEKREIHVSLPDGLLELYLDDA